MNAAMKPPKMEEFTPSTMDMGGLIYDTGRRPNRDMPDGVSALGSRHFPVMVEPGETIVSKTQNMLGGSGITLNIQGDIVTNDATDFAERIATALPEALRTDGASLFQFLRTIGTGVSVAVFKGFSTKANNYYT